jgi:alkanesulfonate monooxygenase SsuD/methylene tetrahydromethanopterin reductase-like flavin-dependent oxidoreductase (luciferase family)
MLLGVHCSNLSWPGGAEALGPTLAGVARAADEGGFTTLTMMDHYFQMEVLGGPPEPMLEGYTSLGFLAGQTSRLELGLLVTGVTYRHPGLLAKIVTTLDVLSGGRAMFGIGAPRGTSASTGASGSPTRRPRSGSSVSRRPCRSSGRHGTAAVRTPASTTRSTRSRWSPSRSGRAVPA